MNHWFHPEARAEFLGSIRYYESQQPGLGRRFLEVVTDTILLIAEGSAHSGFRRPDAERRFAPGQREFSALEPPAAGLLRTPHTRSHGPQVASERLARVSSRRP